jgi:hypothetical protein
MAERKSVPLRIHPRLYEALRRWAEDDFRSVNGQIEWLCQEALLRAGRLPRSDGTADRVGDENGGKEDSAELDASSDGENGG